MKYVTNEQSGHYFKLIKRDANKYAIVTCLADGSVPLNSYWVLDSRIGDIHLTLLNDLLERANLASAAIARGEQS